MLEDVLRFHPNIGLMRYGKRFQKHRKLFHSVFSRAQIALVETASGIICRDSSGPFPVGGPERSLGDRVSLSRSFAPRTIPFPVSPTREYAHALMKAKIDDIIKKRGRSHWIRRESSFCWSRTAAAKSSVLRLLPAILPPEESNPQIYRLVLEHGDFGIHNMTIVQTANGPQVTSLLHWETGHVVPALLSDTEVAVSRELRADGEGGVEILGLRDNDTLDDIKVFEDWARTYVNVVFKLSPEYQRAVEAGRDAMHIWQVLKKWRDEDPEEYFGSSGCWAEERMRELQPQACLTRFHCRLIDLGGNLGFSKWHLLSTGTAALTMNCRRV